MNWKIKQLAKPKLKKTILIEGLPGIGNVGKIATDFLIDSLNAKKLFEIFSYTFPHCVFVNEDDLIELPTIEVFYKNLKDKSLLFLAGDIQPLNETSCYEFCDQILDIFEKNNGAEIITLGGIGLDKIPKRPKVYCTGTNKKIIKKYKGNSKDELHDLIGPIIGVSGVLTGLARKRNFEAVMILAETYAHPAHLGIKGARELLNLLKKRLNLKIKPERLDSEIEQFEMEVRKKIKRVPRLNKTFNDMNYIG